MHEQDDETQMNLCFESGALDFLVQPVKEELWIKRIKLAIDLHQRKLRSKFLDVLLKEENTQGTILHSKLEEMNTLKQKITNDIETPMTTVVNTIQELMSGVYDKEKYKEGLSKIMQTLTQSDLYKPAFVEGGDIDESTRQWLSTQFTTEQKTTAEPNVKRTSLANLTQDNNIKGEKIPFDINSYKPDVDLTQIGFDSTSYSKEELKKIVCYMFKTLDFFKIFNVSENALWTLLGELSTRYRSNPYHNFNHAIDVCQYTFMIIMEKNVNEYLTDFEKLVLIVSALFHDVDHPGVNNIYLMNVRDQLAILYNDISVLENHHSFLSFKILSNPSCNILEGLSLKQFQEFRKSFIKLILATDMTQHFTIVSKFQARIETAPLEKENAEDKIDLMKIIMKCSDISNITRPFPIAKKWAVYCISEFFDQGDKEKEKKLPIGMLNDRDNLNFPKSQIGFVDFVAANLFRNLCVAFPNLKFIMENIEKNKELYKLLLENKAESITDNIDPHTLKKPEPVVKEEPKKEEVKEVVQKESQNLLDFIKQLDHIVTLKNSLNETELKTAMEQIEQKLKVKHL